MPDVALADRLRVVGREAGLDALGFAEADAVHLDPRRPGRAQGRRPARGHAVHLPGPGAEHRPGPDPRGARSLVVGRPLVPARRAARRRPTRPTGRVAAYAWRDHYADLRAALTAVADVLVEAGWRARVVLDDNALVDREAAVRAGLGWYGSNSTVLLPEQGSEFVLGSVVTDADLPPADRAGARRLRALPPLRRRLPDRGHRGPGRDRRPPLPGVAGAGRRRLPRGAPGGPGRPDLRL